MEPMEGSGASAGPPAEVAAAAPAAKNQLDLADLDEEDLKVLSEVSKKGYYHGRPKNEVVQEAAPQRIDAGCSAAAAAGADAGQPRKRADFDDFQKKWDRIDRELSEEESTDVAGTSSRTRIAPSQPTPPPVVADEAVVQQLIGMGFGAEESRAAALATRNQADAAVEYLLSRSSGGGVAPGSGTTATPRSAGPVQADPEKVAMLVEMGISERRARKALEKCGNTLESAVDLALGDMEDEAVTALRQARDSLAQLEADAAALEVEGAGCSSPSGSSPSRTKQLRGLAETVTQLSCKLDTVDVEGDAELREQRRAELDRCNSLDARLAALRARVEIAGEGSPVAAAPEPAAPAAAEAAPASGPSAEASGAQERISEAERLRLAGNAAFKAGDFTAAAKHYEGALELDVENVAILSNLAAAELKLERFHSAAAHAGAANELSGGFSAKALFRQGQAFESLGQLEEACEAYQRAWKVEPTDSLLMQRLTACQRRRDEGR